MATSEPGIRNPRNFRDLSDHVRPRIAMRPGTIYRSDHFGSLDDEDARRIAALGIRRVLDFRGEHERSLAACRLPGVAVHSLAIEPTIVQKIDELLRDGVPLTEADVVAMMQDTYRGFVRNCSPRFAEFFGHLLASDEPTVFHCTAGKDRTGFAAALLLHMLGATEDEMMRDYLLTNERLGGFKLNPVRFPLAVAQVLVGVRPDFLQAAFDAARQDYGSLEGYFREGLGLREAEAERLRGLYLQPAAR